MRSLAVTALSLWIVLGSALTAAQEPAPPAPGTPATPAPPAPAPAVASASAAPAAAAAGGAADEVGGPEAPALATRITSVTLYSDQALVVRQGSAELSEGRSRFEVGSLPAAIRDEAVRARIVSGAGARLANIEVRERHKTIFKKKEAEEAEAALKELQARHKATTDAIAGLEREAALLRGFEVGKRPAGRPEKETPIPIDVGAWEATLKFVDDALSANRKRARELALDLDGTEEELAVAAARAQRLASGKVRAEKAVVLECDAPGKVRVEIEVAYLVPGPGWWPRYDIRAGVEEGKIELTSYALVRQETGEDWENVDLTFSAAEPARAADLPELLAWHIGEAPQVVKSLAAAKEAAVNATTRMHLSETQVLSRSDAPAEGDKLTDQAQKRMESFDPKLPPVQVAQAEESEKSSEFFGQSLEYKKLKKSLDSANKVLGKNDKQAQMQGGKAGRTRELLENLEEQRKTNSVAARNNDWAAFVEGNRQLELGLNQLDDKYRFAFQEDLLACKDDIARGERLLRSARLADGLVPPVHSSRGYDYKYRALRSESIPSDGAFNKVVIGVEQFAAEFAYEAAPLERELAFLASKIKNQRRQPYLEGPSSVFLGPDFVGDGRVPTTARGEEFKVELGADEAVVVKRREDRKRETTGLFTSYHKYRYEVEVTVKNQKARAVRMVVLDRVPFSEEKGLEVERHAMSPPPVAEERKGLLRWQFPLEPGSEKKITFSYSVELAADKAVVGVFDKTVQW
jgi:hypothetical protein